MIWKIKNHRGGFTLIELLVVVAIIGVLASVVLASLNTARVKGRDARRLADVKQIQTALELYFNDNGHYPEREAAYDQSNPCGNASWCGLVADLAPYISSIPGDPIKNSSYYYFYDSDLGDNYQTYGLGLLFESSSNFSKSANDGGYYSSSEYELGQQPAYCMGKYTGTDRSWWVPSSTTVCVGGN